MQLLIPLLTVALAAFGLYWTHRSLNCLFFSAFEYAQASVIWFALHGWQRLLGVQFLLFRGYFSRCHRLLLAVRLVSAAAIVLQLPLMKAGVSLLLVDILYIALAVSALVCWYAGKAEGRDGRRYTVYNAFAPLHDKQRREISRQRNAVRLTGLMRRIKLPDETADVQLPERQIAADHYLQW